MIKTNDFDARYLMANTLMLPFLPIPDFFLEKKKIFIYSNVHYKALDFRASIYTLPNFLMTRFRSDSRLEREKEQISLEFGEGKKAIIRNETI